ncbi:MAG TPA: hypothetical protein VKC17_12040 [Sphingomicrobium sp.]|nr:hypothetical protein [Sphingomicrobium sp.]
MPDTPHRRAPAFVTLSLVVVAWSATVLPQIGNARSAEVASIATLVAFTVLAIVHSKWKKTVRSVKLLEAGKRAFAIMLASSIPFALLSVYLRIAGQDHFATWTLSSILDLQAKLQEWQARSTLKAVTKWLLFGTALLVIGAALFNQPRSMMRWSRYRRSLSQSLSLVSLVLIAFGSFSIIAASSAASPVRIADSKISDVLRRTADSLAELEDRARIVVGEQLASAIIDQSDQGAVDPEQQLETLPDLVGSAETKLAAAPPVTPPPDAGEPPPTSPTISDSLGQITTAYRASIPARKGELIGWVPAYAELKPAEIIQVAKGVDDLTERSSQQERLSPTLRQAVELVVDLVMEQTGIRVPDVEAPKPFGEFFKKIVATLTTKPANEAIRASITDVTVQLVRGETTPLAKVQEIVRPVATKARSLRLYLKDRLTLTQQRLREIELVAAANSASQAEQGSRTDPARIDEGRDGQCVCTITYTENGMVVRVENRTQSCSAPCP